jgi:Fe-S cluster assembly iron-binding protein IscA
MEDFKKAIDEIVKEEIIKLVISNKSNKSIEYNKITFVLKENNNKQYYLF